MSDAEEESLGEDEAEDDSSDDEDAEEEEEDASSEEEAIEPRVLPDRGTRGNRMGGLLEEDEADREFWGQDFFMEEAKDDNLEWETSSSEEEDVPDSDFDLSEDEGEDEGDKDEPKEHRQRRLAPPGEKKRQQAKRGGAAAPPKASKSAPQPRKSSPAALLPLAQAPTLRASTRVRVEVAEAERAHRDQVARRRTKSGPAVDFKPLTQEELLSEAAKTELENLRSLQLLLAREEERKKRTVVKKSKYTGPIVRYHSRKRGDTEEHVLELLNMREAPSHMRRQTAPPAPPRSVCAVTGQPARYRQPRTGLPFLDAAAYAALTGGAPASDPYRSEQRKRPADSYPGADSTDGALDARPDAKRQRGDDGFDQQQQMAYEHWQQGQQAPAFPQYPYGFPPAAQPAISSYP